MGLLGPLQTPSGLVTKTSGICTSRQFCYSAQFHLICCPCLMLVGHKTQQHQQGKQPTYYSLDAGVNQQQRRYMLRQPMRLGSILCACLGASFVISTLIPFASTQLYALPPVLSAVTGMLSSTAPPQGHSRPTVASTGIGPSWGPVGMCAHLAPCSCMPPNEIC